jgi:hypothetical protein
VTPLVASLLLAVSAAFPGARPLARTYCFHYDTGVWEAPAYMEGEEVFVFADTVQLRSGPDTTHEVRAKFTLGARVLVDDRSETTEDIKGLGGYWYRVLAAGKRGYLFGPYLTRACREIDMDADGKPESLLLGFDKELNAVVRVARGGRLFSSFAVKPPQQQGVEGCAARLTALDARTTVEVRGEKRELPVFEVEVFAKEGERRAAYAVPFCFDGNKIRTLKRR